MTYFLGIDGGASKTAAVVCDEAGRVLARIRKGKCVIDNQPTPESLAALVETVQEAMAAAAVAPGADWRGGLGISGIDFEEHIPGQVQAVHQVLGLPAERLTVVNDGIVALWGASPAARAGIIQHGSFMTSAIRSEPGQERIYDNLDVAAAVDLRREAVRLVARMIDGRTPATPLKERLLEQWQVRNAHKFAEMIYRGMIHGQRLWKSLPTLFECWLEGDAAADGLIRKAASDYAHMARAMLQAVGGPAEIAMGGGVLHQAPPRFWHLLEAQFRLDAARRVAPQTGSGARGRRRGHGRVSRRREHRRFLREPGVTTRRSRNQNNNSFTTEDTESTEQILKQQRNSRRGKTQRTTETRAENLRAACKRPQLAAQTAGTS